MTKPGQPEVAEPRRLRWSVPAADVSVNQWLDGQESISSSLRLLIRESIEREGYIDVVNKPVEQLPRRGRPPQGEAEEAVQSRPSQAEYTSPPGSGRVVHQDEPPNQLTSVIPAVAHDIESIGDHADPEPAVTSAEHEAETESASVSARPQASIDEIMSATRR